ncbi:rna polymerase-associated protein rtf1, partial [Cystoisospora suis]
MLQKISLELLNSARLSTERLLHMLEHPQAEKYVRGCFVKVPQPSSSPSNEGSSFLLLPPSPGWVCQIVGIRSCEPYIVRSGVGGVSTPAGERNASGGGGAGGGMSCSYKLVLRVAPKASAKFDREFALTELLNTPVTPIEFEEWKRKLQEFDSVDDLAKRIKAKVQQLKEFTFTDEDVQTILARKQQDSGGGSAVTTSGNLLKQLMSIKHDLDSLNASLSSISTASSSRRDMKEKLQVLMSKKAEIEARIARRKAAGGDQRKPGFLHGFLSMEKRRQKLQQASFLQPTKRNCTRDLVSKRNEALHSDHFSLPGGGK